MDQQQIPIMKVIWVAFFATVILFGLVLQYTGNSTIEDVSPFVFQVAFAVLAAVCLGLAFWLPKLIYRGNKEGSAAAEVSRYYVPWVMRVALLEQIAVAGFVLAILTGDDFAYIPFAVVTVIAYGMSFPSPDRLSAIFD
jgi:hypothetical protein